MLCRSLLLGPVVAWKRTSTRLCWAWTYGEQTLRLLGTFQHRRGEMSRDAFREPTSKHHGKFGAVPPNPRFLLRSSGTRSRHCNPSSSACDAVKSFFSSADSVRWPFSSSSGGGPPLQPFTGNSHSTFGRDRLSLPYWWGRSPNKQHHPTPSEPSVRSPACEFNGAKRGDTLRSRKRVRFQAFRRDNPGLHGREGGI